MRAVDENMFDNGFGTQQYMDGQTLLTGNLLSDNSVGVVYGGGGGVSTGGGGGVSTPAPIVISNEPGTATFDDDYQIRVEANIKGAAIIVNGENTYKTSDDNITYAISDILKHTSKTITLEIQGYDCNEKYVLGVVNNPDYYKSYIDNGININPYDSLIGYQTRQLDVYNSNQYTYGTPYDSGTSFYAGGYSNPVIYSNTPAFILRIQHFINDVFDSDYSFNTREKYTVLKFNLTPSAAIILPPPPPEDERDYKPVDPLVQKYKFTIGLEGPNNSAIAYITKANGSNTTFNLVSGINEIVEEIGTQVEIQTSDLNLYRVKQISVESETQKNYKESSDNTESISTIINLDRDILVNIISENFAIVQKSVPTISFLNTPIVDNYNIKTGADIPIGLVKSADTSDVTVSVNNKEFKFSNLGTGQSAVVILPASAFSTIGSYKIIVKPTNTDGDGKLIESDITVVDDIFVGVPDITNIQYPAVLRGPDYVGTDVEFAISYDSINTDFVRLFVDNGTSLSTDYIELGKSGVSKFNFQSLLKYSTTTFDDEQDKIPLTLKLIPYNISGREVVVGKRETFTILFDKGDLTIPRDVAIARIAEGFISQFDFKIFEDETSKYLTHLLHLGKGDNKVITTWVGDGDSLILKLYEPLPTSVQPNQQIWISKIQSNPIVETITISGVDTSYCPPLKGPNFSLEADNGIAYKIFDDLIASGSQTSTDLLNQLTQQNSIDTEKLNIQYVSGSTELGWEYSFSNYVHFGSAEERINNFFYKLKLLENYKFKYDELIAATYSPPPGPLLTEDSEKILTEDDLYTFVYELAKSSTAAQVVEAKSYADKINNLVKGFDGFEKFLYKSENDLGFPKKYKYSSATGLTYRVLRLTTEAEATSWFDYAVYAAANYDKDNTYSMKNNMPEHIIEDYQNAEFLLFLDMIGQHFDIIWCYISALKNTNLLEAKQDVGIPDSLVYNMLESLGWKGKRAFNSDLLWEYLFGTTREGGYKYSMPLADANNEVWRRILNNLPYLLKHKGTGRAMKAVMACYGVPQSMLTIMEFGGPQDPTKGGSSQFTFDDRTAAIQMKDNASISIPWHVNDSTGRYPEAIEFRIKPDIIERTRIISASQFTLDIVPTTGSYATLEFNLGSGVSEPYFEASGVGAPYMDTAITYVLGPELYTGSLDFPLSTEHYSNILMNRHDYGGTNSLYEILLKTSDGKRIITSVSMSLFTSSEPWETGSIVHLGNDFSGSLDEVRLWTVPLQMSKLENHTLFPDAINGNSYTASTSDLLLRLDFEYPKDRVADIGIKNVAINSIYGEPYITASNFYSAPTYPYQYIPYDRTVTATVPSLGFNVSNKIRFEEQEMTGDLSYKARATKKSFDRAPIDTNHLGLFFSPIKELNMDILKTFGDFNIDNYIGDPSDEYKEKYSELDALRHYYFERLGNRDIYEYIQLVKYIDKSLFETLADLAPARTNISKGLLIEPHYLERSKTRWDRPIAEHEDYTTLIDASKHYVVESESLTKDAHLDIQNLVTLSETMDNYDVVIDANEICNLQSNTLFYDTAINAADITLIEADAPFYDAEITAPNGASLVGSAEAFKFEAIGMEKDSLANLGYGVYVNHGSGIVHKYDGLFGNYNPSGSRQNVYLVKEQYTQKVSTQIAGYPVNGALPGDQVKYKDVSVTKYKYRVSILPYSGSIEVGNNIVSVKALDGYFPTHYRFTNNLTEGMQRSYFKGSLQTATTTPDGLDPVETFTTNPNILRVAKTGRGSGEPILEVD